MSVESNVNNLKIRQPHKSVVVENTLLKTDIYGQQKVENASHTSNQFDLPSFKCPECSYQSIWKHAVKRHQRIHFKDDHNPRGIKKNKLQCLYCSTILDSWEEFQAHQTDHHDSQQEPSKRGTFKCPVCQFESLNEICFDNHKKVHDFQTESGTFECDQCAYITNKKKIFLKHIRMLHEKGGDLQTNCKELIAKLDSKGSKRVYKRGKYADVPVKTTKNGLFQCEHCSYQTAIRTALVKHQTNHAKTANT